jgi:hypothetical protein
MEKSRTEVHAEDTKQISSLRKSLEAHICDYDELKVQILALMPLADLILPLQEIVQDKKTSQAVDARFAKWARIILTIGGVIGAIFVIIQAIFRLEK